MSATETTKIAEQNLDDWIERLITNMKAINMDPIKIPEQNFDDWIEQLVSSAETINTETGGSCL